MNGHWLAVFNISERRHDTNVGVDHLTAHGLEVLNRFAMEERAEAIADAFGYTS